MQSCVRLQGFGQGGIGVGYKAKWSRVEVF